MFFFIGRAFFKESFIVLPLAQAHQHPSLLEVQVLQEDLKIPTQHLSCGLIHMDTFTISQR